MRRVGIFARLRRRRLALCLAFGYALLLNALLASVSDVRAIAAAIDPLSASASLCGTTLPAPAGNRQSGDQHQHECPLCGPACSMGGYSQGLALTGGAMALLPAATKAIRIAWEPAQSILAHSRRRGDPVAQAPPLA